MPCQIWASKADGSKAPKIYQQYYNETKQLAIASKRGSGFAASESKLARGLKRAKKTIGYRQQFLRLPFADPRQALFFEQSGSVFYCPAGYAAHCASEKEGRHQHAGATSHAGCCRDMVRWYYLADFVIQQGTNRHLELP